MASNTVPANFHIYNMQSPAFTTTNYERVALGWGLGGANVFTIVTEFGGSGVQRLLALGGFAKAGAPAAGDLPTNTFSVIDDTSANKTWLAFNKAGTIRQTEIGGGGGGGGMSIGGAITGGTAGRVLFAGAGGILDDDSTFLWNDTLKDLAIGGAYYVNASRALYAVPNVSGANWFEGNAGNQTVTGRANFGTGDLALSSLTTGYDNVAMGGSAMRKLTSGSNNFAFGTLALELDETDQYNVAIGYGSMARLGNAGTGGGSNQYNIAIGFNALSQAEMSTENVIVGANALNYVTPPCVANGNTIIGKSAGSALGFSTTGAVTQNTLIGLGAGNRLQANSSYNTWIGPKFGPTATLSNTISLSTQASAGFWLDCNVSTAYAWSFHACGDGTPSSVHFYKAGNQPGEYFGTTDYERVELDWQRTSNVFRITSRAGGTGVVRLIAIDGFAKAGAPASGDLPSGTFSVIDDTSGGATWLVFNNAGTIRKVQLT